MNIPFGRCGACDKDLNLNENGTIHMARIQRGYFTPTFDNYGNMDDFDETNEPNIKAEFWICTDCYLENPILCKFFNSIGLNIR